MGNVDSSSPSAPTQSTTHATHTPTGDLNPRVLLVRHGETEWSRAGRHTGTTDIGLTTAGEAQADSLRPILGTLNPALVLSSPLIRAKETAKRAGFEHQMLIEPLLTEWDYETAEGITTLDMRETTPGWTVWTHPIVDGESLEQVAERADSVIETIRATDGNVIAFAHAHMLRIIAARWCGWAPVEARRLPLSAASVSELGYDREAAAIIRWNWLPSNRTF